MKGRFDWKAAYFNLVSLVAMVFFLFAAVSGGQGVLRTAFPTLSLVGYEWEAIESFSAYKRQYGNSGGKLTRAGPDAPDTTFRPLTETELRQAWEEHKQLAIQGERRRGMWNLLESLATMVVAVPVLIFHRRQAKRLRPEPEPVDTV